MAMLLFQVFEAEAISDAQTERTFLRIQQLFWVLHLVWSLECLQGRHVHHV